METQIHGEKQMFQTTSVCHDEVQTQALKNGVRSMRRQAVPSCEFGSHSAKRKAILKSSNHGKHGETKQNVPRLVTHQNMIVLDFLLKQEITNELAVLNTLLVALTNHKLLA